MVLSDIEIRRLVMEKDMISPFQEGCVREIPEYLLHQKGNGPLKVLSFGLSSGGYDVRLEEEFKVFTNVYGNIIDPKRFNEQCLVDMPVIEEGNEKYIIIPPNSYALGLTVERFNIPRNVGVIVIGKSTYARCGIICNVTPIEPGFEGKVVIELANTTNLPAKVYANEGIAQFIFYYLDQDCEVSYGDRAGKYQGQNSLTLSKV